MKKYVKRFQKEGIMTSNKVRIHIGCKGVGLATPFICKNYVIAEQKQ